MSILVFNCTRVSSQSSRQEKEIKVIQIRKGKVKLSVFIDDMILYREDPKEYTKKLLELINMFSKVVRYKITKIRCISIHLK